MSDTLTIVKTDNSYIRVIPDDPGIVLELNEFFKFKVPGYQFMPAFRAKMWDGSIHLYDTRTGAIYAGLRPHVEKFAKQRSYAVEFEGFTDQENRVENSFDSDKFFLGLKPMARDGASLKEIVPDDFQLGAFQYAVENQRCLLLSPTASGKSLIIYALIRYYLSIGESKIMIVVPKTSLVEQMFSDFDEYGANDPIWDSEKVCHRIYEGKSKESKKPVFITTWQSIYKESSPWFQQFRAIIGDEAHGFKAKSLTNIMCKLGNAAYRVGTSGTLQESKVHKLVLEGLFGPILQVTTTKELMDLGRVADLQIHAILLDYDDESKKLLKDAEFQDEFQWLVEHPKRNKFIRNLTLSLKGNTLVLYQRVDAHGKPLYFSIADKADGKRKVFFIHGKVETENRERIRKLMETETDAIIVASYGTFKEGVNIRNLHNIIFASPYRSRIVVLQSIGRGLRVGANKQKLNLYDIADNLQYKKRKNHTLKHFLYRVGLYNEEKFDTKFYKLEMKGKNEQQRSGPKPT